MAGPIPIHPTPLSGDPVGTDRPAQMLWEDYDYDYELLAGPFQLEESGCVML